MEKGLKPALRFALVCILLAFSSSPVSGSGLWLYDVATPDVGTASAGNGARAQDASTAALNPAGMTRLDRPQVLVGFQPMIVDIQFDSDSGTSSFLGANDGGNAGGLLPMIAGYYVQPVSERWRLGFSLTSFFGLGVDYEDDWVGRYYVQESLFLTVAAVPSVGYKVNDWLSLGAGVPLVLGALNNKLAINNLMGSDGQMEYEDTTFGVGGQFGIMIEPRQGTRLGITYSSPVDLTFKAVPDFKDLGIALEEVLSRNGLLGSEIEVGMTIPQQVRLSAYHEFTPEFALLGSLGWQNWSAFGEIPIGIDSEDPKSLTADLNFNDTWHVSFGGHYRFHPKWRATAGFAYDSSPVSDEDRTITMPLDRQFRYAGGLIYDMNDKFTLGMAYEFIDLGSASVTQNKGPLAGTVSGDYSSNYIHVISLNVSWRF